MLQKVLERARKITTPKPEEHAKAKEIAQHVIEKISKHSENSPFNPKVIAGGSYARDTWLPGNADIDVFLSYPLEATKTDLEKDSYKISCMSFGEDKLIIRYAEHPYVETYFEGVRVNVVPCYSVEAGQWQTAADRSPFHLRFMQKQLNQKQKSDIRLLKKFMQVSESYGAEIKIGGFSGYFCEVLIYRFNNFENLLSEAQKWRLPLIITDEDSQEYVKERYLGDEVIITDPIDRNRNLGRALSIVTLSRFILACRSFMKKPKLDYFIEKKKEPIIGKISSPLIDNMLCIVFEHKKMSVDILWGMLNHTVNSLTKHFQRNDFKIIRSNAVSDDKITSAFIFLFETMTISPFHIRVGPKIFDEDNVEKFSAKNCDSSLLLWIDDDARIKALKDRPWASTKGFIKEILKDPSKFGVSKKIVQPMRDNHKIYIGREIVSDERKWIREGVNELLEPKDQDYLTP